MGGEVDLPIALEVGPEGIAVGGSVALVVSAFWGWSPPAPEPPVGPEGVSFDVRVVDTTLFATVRGRALRPGEEVAFRYLGRADRFAERAPALLLGVDADGDGVRALVPGAVEVRTLAGPCARVVATLPSAAHPGDDVVLRVAWLDAVGNAGCGFAGEVPLALPPWLAGPDRVRVASADGSVAAVTLRAVAEGIGVVGVGPGAVSNPLVVRAGAERIRWGDLQIHTARSDGTGDPADVLAYARDVAGLDVAALTDHDHWGFRFLDADPGARAAIAGAVRAARRPGFEAVLGYEWTSWIWGHRHVLLFDDAEPWPSSLAPGTDTPDGLRAALRGRDVVVIPHHPAGGPVALDWSAGLDAALEPVVEVASVHGQSASPELPGPIYDAVPGGFAEDHLRAGERFGVVGGTDGHDGHPGLSQLAGGGGGLTAFVGEGTPAELLRARRVYATNGPRILLRVAVDGVPMGGSHPPGPAEAEVRVVGTHDVLRVEVHGPAGLLASRPGRGPVLHAVLPFELDGLAWVRVIQADGGLAWSSPIFAAP